MSLNYGLKPINCLNCGRFISWAPLNEEIPASGAVSATKWFCSQLCLYSHALKHGIQVKKPRQARDVMTELLEEIKKKEELAKWL